MKSSILAIDIGTSSCKAVLFSETGMIAAQGKGQYSLKFPQEGRVEQDPEEIFAGVGHAVQELSEKGGDLSSVQAVAFSAQMSSQFLVDQSGKPLTNLISWMDGRAYEEAEEFTGRFTKDQVRELTGVDMVVTPAYSIAKLLWLKRHMPECMEKAFRFVQIKDYVIYRMTGEWVSDPTSLKGLVHQQTGEPVPEIFAFIGASPDLLPEVRKPWEIAGNLMENVPGFKGIPTGIPVVTGWNDMNAAFLGMGALADGCVGLDITGTSEHLGCVSPERTVCPEEYQGLNRVPFFGDREAFYGVTSSGGQAAEWFVKDFMRQKSVPDYFEKLFAEEQEVRIADENRPIFLPYIEGERNPWNNPDARGVFFGLNRSHRQIDAAMSVLEGVCFALRAIEERLPEKPEYFVVSGGASVNDLWNQMKADVMNIPFVRLETVEAGCAGAEILAMMALNPDRPLDDIVGTAVRRRQIYQPDEKRHACFEKRYKKFIELYYALEKLF